MIFFKTNIVNPSQVRALTRAFHQAGAPLPVLIAVDQEGGKIQRLSASKGFPNFASAQKVSEQGEAFAKGHYRILAQTLRAKRPWQVHTCCLFVTMSTTAKDGGQAKP